MYLRKWDPRAWAVIPTVVLVVAIGMIAGPADAAAYTTQVPLAMLTMSVAPVDVWGAPTVTVAVGTTAVQIPVAAPLVQRLPATSTSDEAGPPMLLGFLLGVSGVLAIFAWRKSVAARVIHIFTR